MKFWHVCACNCRPWCASLNLGKVSCSTGSCVMIDAWPKALMCDKIYSHPIKCLYALYENVRLRPLIGQNCGQPTIFLL